jgi:hypothetical protein
MRSELPKLVCLRRTVEKHRCIQEAEAIRRNFRDFTLDPCLHLFHKLKHNLRISIEESGDALCRKLNLRTIGMCGQLVIRRNGSAVHQAAQLAITVADPICCTPKYPPHKSLGNEKKKISDFFLF